VTDDVTRPWQINVMTQIYLATII